MPPLPPPPPAPQCWLLSPWRQQGAFVLSVSTAQLVAAVSERRGGLLRYVPELYCTTVLDMVRLNGVWIGNLAGLLARAAGCGWFGVRPLC